MFKQKGKLTLSCIDVMNPGSYSQKRTDIREEIQKERREGMEEERKEEFCICH